MEIKYSHETLDENLEKFTGRNAVKLLKEISLPELFEKLVFYDDEDDEIYGLRLVDPNFAGIPKWNDDVPCSMVWKQDDGCGDFDQTDEQGNNVSCVDASEGGFYKLCKEYAASNGNIVVWIVGEKCEYNDYNVDPGEKVMCDALVMDSWVYFDGKLYEYEVVE